MPRITTNHFLVGYVRAKMEQLRNIVVKLDNESRHYSKAELEEINEETQMIDLEIKTQMRLVEKKVIESVMAEYRGLVKIVEAKLQARLAGETGFTDRRNQPSTSKGFKKKNKKAKRSKLEGELEYVSGGTSNASMGGYASDNSEPMAIELLTKIEVGEGIKLPTLKLKETKHEQSSENALSNQRQSSEKALSNQRQSSDDSSRAQVSMRTTGGPVSGKMSSRISSTSFSSYKSIPQEKFSEPVKGITYPPMAWKLPYPLSKKDPNIIGMSEIYTNPCDTKGKCMICKGGHKMYRCTNMVRAGLQERWYLALSAGVCLHCLYPRHSSFTCKEGGACFRCGTRHNSILCPKNPNNIN